MKHPAPEIAASWVTTVHGTMLSETALDHRYLRKMPWSKIFGAINRNGFIVVLPELGDK